MNIENIFWKIFLFCNFFLHLKTCDMKHWQQFYTFRFFVVQSDVKLRYLMKSKCYTDAHCFWNNLFWKKSPFFVSWDYKCDWWCFRNPFLPFNLVFAFRLNSFQPQQQHIFFLRMYTTPAIFFVRLGKTCICIFTFIWHLV